MDLCDFCRTNEVDWPNAPYYVDGFWRFLCGPCIIGVEEGKEDE